MIKAQRFDNICVVDAEGRARNVNSSLARGLPVCGKQAKRDGSLAIVASGPSVPEHLDELRNFDEVWAINGAYDYLTGQGIIPHGFFCIDPLPGMAEYVQKPHKDTTFYVSSFCDPSVFDALKGHTVRMWHPTAEDAKYPDGHMTVNGGTTAVTRAPYLALMLGWRDITLFGVDSSYTGDGSEYCYKWGTYGCDIAAPKILVEVNGEGPFLTEIGLLKQVWVLNVLNDVFRGMLKIRCGGIMDAYLRAPMRDDSDIEIEDAA